MRALLAALTMGVVGAVLVPAHPAEAWWDGYGRWHPNWYRPGVVYAPTPPPYYARPYARWIPPHYNHWGQLIPGHWV